MSPFVSDAPKRYFGIHYVLLRFLGLGWWHHPDEGNTDNFPGLYLYYSIITEIVVFGFVSLESIDPFIGEKDLDRFMFSIAFVVTHDLTLIKMYLFFFKNRDIQDIVHTLEIDMHNYYQNNLRNRQTVRFTRIMTAAFVFFGWMTIANVNVYGIIQDIHWKSEVSAVNNSAIKPFRTLPQPIYIPWNYQTDTSFILTFLLETVGLLWTGHIVLTIDTFIGSLILHMSSQFEILQEALVKAYDRTMSQLLEGVPDNDETMLFLSEDLQDRNIDDYNEIIVRRYFTDEEIERALEKTLKNCLEQHQLLISCVEKFAKTYSYGFMIQLISSTTAICVVMVQISQDASSFKSIRIVTSLAFFGAMVIQLAIQCFSGNELTYQAGKVADAVMQCKWERMSPRLRKLLVMPMMRAQRPLHLSAASFANMDNNCFLAIMKAAYSYYAVLSQKQV
ncbi:odorant receptor Or1-like [Epargyreus clarus]|uniref:odorant receptor Or1-like n=1 Tax=Epargyreus clarus TaxID=520877 RepID=UPI003C2FFB7C